MGRYVGLGISPGAVIDASGNDIEPIPSYSANIAYRKVFGDRSLSGGFSYIGIDNDVALTGDSATSQSQSWFVALTQNLGKNFSVGAEYLQGKREIESGLEGQIDRVTFSVRKGF
ncbi:MAG: hypothetical protein ABNH53_15770 [Henriciella sp.]|jgi:hypothetical protein